MDNKQIKIGEERWRGYGGAVMNEGEGREGVGEIGPSGNEGLNPGEADRASYEAREAFSEGQNDERQWTVDNLALGRATLSAPVGVELGEVKEERSLRQTKQEELTTEGVMMQARDGEGVSREEQNAIEEMIEATKGDPFTRQQRFMKMGTAFKLARYGWMLGEEK